MHILDHNTKARFGNKLANARLQTVASFTDIVRVISC